MVYYCATHNKHTFFALTKMCLFEEEEDFGKINSLYFFHHWVAWLIFYYFWKLCDADIS